MFLLEPDSGRPGPSLAFVLCLITAMLLIWALLVWRYPERGREIRLRDSAAANILIPLAVSMTAGFVATVAIAVALGASAAMCLPVATPPNAKLFATGGLTTWDLIRVGLVVGLITPLIGLAWLTGCLKLIF